MSNKITINAIPPVQVTFENVWTKELEEKEFIALDALVGVPDNDVFNSGLASLGDPHIDEYDNGKGALREDHNPWNAKHVASIRLYGSNSYVYLLPGDKLTIEAKTASEAVYYAMLKSDLLKVTTTAITEGDAREEDKFEDEYLGRTTGIGDVDDGNDEFKYPLEFDSEKYTHDVIEGNDPVTPSEGE